MTNKKIINLKQIHNYNEILNTLLRLKVEIETCYRPVKDLAKEYFPELEEIFLNELEKEVKALYDEINNLIGANQQQKDLISIVQKNFQFLEATVAEKLIDHWFYIKYVR